MMVLVGVLVFIQTTVQIHQILSFAKEQICKNLTEEEINTLS